MKLTNALGLTKKVDVKRNNEVCGKGGGGVLMYKIVMLWTFIFDRVIVCKFNAGRGADDTCCAQYTLLFWPVNTGPVFITKLVMIFKNSDFLSLFYKNL